MGLKVFQCRFQDLVPKPIRSDIKAMILHTFGVRLGLGVAVLAFLTGRSVGACAGNLQLCLNTKSMQNNGPKPRRIATKAIILHTFGVQVILKFYPDVFHWESRETILQQSPGINPAPPEAS